MKVKKIYETIEACGLTGSQVEFSRLWLGRSPRYYSHLVAVQREPGVATLCGIIWRLERFIQTTRCGPDQMLLDLKQALAAHIEHRAITDIHMRCVAG